MIGRYDIVIRDAAMFDGTGAPPERADMAVEGDRIAHVGDLGSAVGAIEIIGSDLAVAPGFVDVHTHDDFAALLHPHMEFKTRGGVTTCVVGNCGFGVAPFSAAVAIASEVVPLASISSYDGYAGYMQALETQRTGANVGVLAGHGTIRLAAVDRPNRAPSAGEMATMKALLCEALEAGVLGLSTGLAYEPGCYATTDEIVELSRMLQGSGALYATHLRDEGPRLVEAVQEAIEIGTRAQVPVQISHHKAEGRENWGRVAESLDLIEAAQMRGESVHSDQYPYTASSTLLRAVLHAGAFAEQPEPDSSVAFLLPEDVLLSSVPKRPEWEGISIGTLSDALDLPARAAAEKVVEEAPGTSVILHTMCEDDVRTVLRHHSTMVGSDGIPTLDGKPHPRLYNTFARVLGHYARDEGLLALETAIHRMTGFPAEKFGLVDRGVIRQGAFADLVVFDPDTIIDRGTYEAPNRYPHGIIHVFVNGQQVVHNGRSTGRRPGQVIRR